MSDLRYYRCSSCGGLNRVPTDKLASGPVCGRCGASLDVAGAPQVVSDDELDSLVASAPVPVLVDFYADWCGPCRALAPVMKEIGQNLAGQLIVVKVDTEEHKRTAQTLGVRGIPAMFLYKNGSVVDKTAGLQTLGALTEFVQPHL